MKNHGGSGHRTERIASIIKRDVSVIVDSLSDPRIYGVTVVDAEMSRDLKYATVFVIIDSDEAKVLKALNACSGYIRHVLAEENSEMRGVPRLNFVADKSQAYSERIERVLREIHNEHGG